MQIAAALIEEIVQHAREDAPNECCGMIGGNDGQATMVYRATNAEASPLRFSIDAQEQFALMRRIEDAGQELLGIYHSHTRSTAYPSQTDVNLAAWPDAVYVIVSLERRQEPDVRGFWIREGQISDAELDIS